MANTDRIRETLNEFFSKAQTNGKTGIEIIARELHKEVDFIAGSHPNQMPSVCNVMHEFMGDDNIVLHETPSGRSTTLKILYRIPR